MRRFYQLDALLTIGLFLVLELDEAVATALPRLVLDDVDAEDLAEDIELALKPFLGRLVAEPADEDRPILVRVLRVFIEVRSPYRSKQGCGWCARSCKGKWLLQRRLTCGLARQGTRATHKRVRTSS